MTLLESLRRRWQHRWYATGGRLPATTPDPDLLPCLLSPGRSTTVRPGETHHDYSGWVEKSLYGPDRIVERNQRPGESFLEMTERLMEGEDL